VPSHLLDTRLFDFAGLRAGGEANPEGDIGFDTPTLNSGLPQLVDFPSRRD
jgi:tRNA 2-thiocytidine biosynthesis protein TtcA